MIETTTKVDGKGRIMIPKKIREKMELKEGSRLTMKVEGNTIIIKPMKPVADRYYGAFKVNRWPDDVDEFVVEVMKKWWATQST